MGFHRWIGIIAILITLLVNSVCVTYFIGTSRWCKEVVAAYSMDQSYAEESLRLKRKSFPYSLASILISIFITGMGAAADPDNNLIQSTSVWVTPHGILAVIGTILIGWSFLVQVGMIGANYDVIEKILRHVEEIRTDRLEPEKTEHAGKSAVEDEK